MCPRGAQSARRVCTGSSRRVSTGIWSTLPCVRARMLTFATQWHQFRDYGLGIKVQGRVKRRGRVKRTGRVKHRGRVQRREQGRVKRREGAQSVKDAHLEEEEAHRVVDVGVQGHRDIEVDVHACAHMRTHLRPQALAQTWARYRKASLRPCA